MSDGLVWSFVLSIIGITGLLIAGRKNKWGWALNFGAQLLWIIFAVVTAQYGFILSALGYGTVYWINFMKWRREEKPKQDKNAEWSV